MSIVAVMRSFRFSPELQLNYQRNSQKGNTLVQIIAEFSTSYNSVMHRRLLPTRVRLASKRTSFLLHVQALAHVTS